jgi:threonine dehydrogenase-like Zn-dependent dehydrogenase
MLGAAKVIAIDRVPERLEMARQGGAHTLDYSQVDDIIEVLKEMTGGRGPDSCIDAVGMEGHGTSLAAWYDSAKHAMKMETDRPIALRQAIQACRKGGTVSIPGVYGGLLDKMPFGAAFNKALTLKMGQTHVQKYLKPLLEKVQKGEIDPSFVITHKLKLSDASRGYEVFRSKEDQCIKIVMQPHALG